MTEPNFQTTSNTRLRSSETSTPKETTMKKLLNGITALLLSLHATAAPVQDPITSPVSLDFYWETYFATGNPEAVERIVDYIIEAQTTAAHPPDYIDDFTLTVAILSTRSNMEQNTTIDSIVRKHIQKQSEANKKLLEQTLLAPQDD